MGLRKQAVGNAPGTHRHHLWIVQIQHPSLLVLEDALEQTLVGGAVGQVGIVAVFGPRLIGRVEVTAEHDRSSSVDWGLVECKALTTAKFLTIKILLRSSTISHSETYGAKAMRTR
jgi:hypothetical protein